ncbi:TPA: ComC/BlpC family leader-containing pheromone/bacteriocin [Streptococcus pyogenes]|nr:ComC/BlpC family leader-containing pheromone/bacteriocin [Streptococcus pyogenes]
MNTKTMEQFNTLSADKLAIVEGGFGYTWQCSDDKVSARHWFRKTAEDNMKAYEKISGATCAIFHA